MKKILTLLMSLSMALSLCSFSVYAAPDWPADISVESGGAVVVDANTRAVIYGKNMHEQYFPASITKILTALIVLENCEMDEVVEFSRNAIYNVESQSTNANLAPGDQLSVEDTLYALLLKSANEAANGLAEHVAGSNEAFAEMMNEKAKELGCQNSNFENPSGLNGENHYTSAYDMALIACAAFQREDFVKIASSRSYKLPATRQNPDGLEIFSKHRMRNSNDVYYVPSVIGGKTGYTMLAGNTLVTCAEQDGMKLITVVLKAQNPQHYLDTTKLLDFGFSRFKSLNISEHEAFYSDIEVDLKFAGLPSADLSVLAFSKDTFVTLPMGADFTDALSSVSFDMRSDDPPAAVAKIQYTYNERLIGTTYLMRSEKLTGDMEESPVGEGDGTIVQSDNSTETESGDYTDSTAEPIPIDTTPFEISPRIFKIMLSILISIILIIGLVMWRMKVNREEEEARILRQKKRQQRLTEIGVSSTDFEQLLGQKRRRTSDFPNDDDDDISE